MTIALGDYSRESGDDTLVIEAERQRDDARRVILDARARMLDEREQRARDPWVDLRLGGQVIASIPVGESAVFDAPTGYGKTSACSAMAFEHAVTTGPAIYCSLELGSSAIADRIIGSQLCRPWDEVMRGGATRQEAEAVLPERLYILDDDRARLDALPERIREVRAAWPGQPIVAWIDYLQLDCMAGEDMRGAVARKAELGRLIAKQERIALGLVSQPSRAAAKELRAGERVGADTISVSAESAQIERGAAVTFALGGASPVDERGWSRMDLSIGKARYGGGDRVFVAWYHGAHGRWRLEADPQRAADVRANREAERDTARTEAARLAMVAAASLSKEPLTSRELRAKAHCSYAIAAGALTAAVAAGELSEYPPKGRSRYPTYWTPGRSAGGAE